MSTVNNMQIQDDEGNVFHPETSIEQIVGENGTQVFPGGKPGNMESSDMTTAFTESKMRENIKSGEKHRVLFGKIQKFFTDLKTVAFSGKYGDLSERPTLGGAAGYKVADNDTTNSSEFLSTARVAYEHGQEIDALSRDLGGCSFEQEGDNFYVVGADAVRKKLGESIFEKIGGMNPSSSSIPGYCKFDTGITGKVLWQSIFIVPMIIPASGSANNNLYNGGGITYDAKTGVITVNALYVKIVADIYYIID